MSGGAGDISKSPKKKSTMPASNTDGVPRATTSNASGGGTLNRGGGGGGGGGGGKGRKRAPMADIEGEPRYTGREMRLTAAVAILTILLFGLASFVVVSGPLAALLNPRCLDEKLGFSGLCDSEECIDISYRSVHSANFSSDPCEDFYKFACAKWQTQHTITDGELIVAANINQLKDSVDGFLRTLLEQETPSHKADPGVIALKNFYKSCMNFTNPNENELILDLLDSLGGYKTPDLWSETKFDLTEVILKFLQVNAAPLFDLTLDIDAKNRERYALIVELPRPTSLVPNLFRPPHQDDDLMHSEYSYYHLTEENEAISSLDMAPGLFNTTSQSSSTRTPSSSSSGGSNSHSGTNSNGSGSGAADGDSSNSDSSSGTSTVERHAWYKMIKELAHTKNTETRLRSYYLLHRGISSEGNPNRYKGQPEVSKKFNLRPEARPLIKGSSKEKELAHTKNTETRLRSYYLLHRGISSEGNPNRYKGQPEVSKKFNLRPEARPLIKGSSKEKDSLDSKKRDELKSLVRKVGQLIRMSEAEILSDSQDLAVIASNIEKIKPSQRSRKFWKQQNKEYNAYTLDQLQHQFGTVQWSFLFGELMGFDDVTSREVVDDYYYTRASGSTSSSNKKGNNTAINWHNSTIYVPYPDYLRRVLQMTQYTNKRMLYNTMLIMYVKDMLHDLIPRSPSPTANNSMKDEPKQQQHHSRVRGQQHRSHHRQYQPKQQQRKQQRQQSQLNQQQPRWKFCVQSTKSVFSMELSSLYMKSFKPSSLKRIAHDVEEIFANVKETLIAFLNRSIELSSQDGGEEKQENPYNNLSNNNHTNNHSQVPLSQERKGTGTNGGVGGGSSTGEISNNGNVRNEHRRNGSNSHSSNNSSSGGRTNGDANADSNSSYPNGKTTFKDEAIRKIANLKGNFIGPSFYLQEDFLDDAIKNIRMNPNDFLFNMKVVYRTFREQLYHLYWKPVDEERATWAFVTFPTTVNAFYIPQFNSIVIPLAFLNPPNFVEGAPVYINYATIAHTLSHEALHALDRTGSGFDADGRLHDGWEAERKGFLQEKANCVAKQYSESFRKILPFYQTHVSIQVDGNLTQNENLADIAGLQVAFSAYRKYRFAASSEDLKAERRIPGLVLTLEQAYFLTFAQAYCANISPMWYIFFLEMEEHTPHPERINGMLMNSPEFAEAYSCRAGSQMNPPLKCSVW